MGGLRIEWWDDDFKTFIGTWMLRSRHYLIPFFICAALDDLSQLKSPARIRISEAGERSSDLDFDRNSRSTSISKLMVRVHELNKSGLLSEQDKGLAKNLILVQPNEVQSAFDAMDNGNKSPWTQMLYGSAGSNASVGPGANSDTKIGRWTEEEQAAFIDGLRKYGKNWKKISQMVKTRTLTQIRTHAQKFFKKAAKEKLLQDSSMQVQSINSILYSLYCTHYTVHAGYLVLYGSLAR
jgi:SHAQKYF class myb-like DNA-binding protein